VATGSRNTSPIEPPPEAVTREQVAAHLHKVQCAVAAAPRIAIIGGGVVGVELAGEIRDRYAGKTITILNSGADILSSATMLPKSFRKRLLRLLASRNIMVKLNATAELDGHFSPGQTMLEDTRTIRTVQGDRVEADLFLLCLGSRPRTDGLPGSWLNDAGEIKVRRSLQSIARADVFALGDVCDFPEIGRRMFLYSQFQVPILTRNARSVALGRKPRLRHIGLPWSVMVVPVGARTGLTRLSLVTAGSPITRFLKGRSLLVKKTFEAARAAAPHVPPREQDEEDLQAAQAPVSVG